MPNEHRHGGHVHTHQTDGTQHKNIPVFPTHRLYLGHPPKYIWWHIFVFIIIIIIIIIPVHFFFAPRENETISNRLTIGKSPLALHVSYGSFCMLENCRHSHRQPPVFPIRSFICGEPPQPPSAISVTTDERDFSNFQTLLADFFP